MAKIEQDYFMAPGAFDAEGEELRRRKALADALMQQGSQTPQGQIIAGHYVAPSWTQFLNQGLSKFLGAKQDKAVSDDMKELGDRRRAQASEEATRMADALFGRQAQTIQPPTPNDDEGNANAPVAVPAQARNLAEALRISQNSQNPLIQRFGLEIPGMEQKERIAADERKARADELEARRIENARLQAERLQEQSKQAALNRELRSEIARLTAASRPEPMMTVLGPQGEPIALPRSQAAGMTPYSPALAKQIQAEAQKKTAKGDVNEIVTQIARHYDTLKKGGGVTTTGGSPLTNLGARIGNTAPGQFIGSVFGTENQQARDSISQTRPLLMNAIKQATGMSAQQLNSNAELQFYLKAATDPGLGYEANMGALRNLDKLYGLGLVEPSQATPPGGGGLPSQDAIAAEIARRKGGK